MDTETMRSRKQQLRRDLRARRERDYAGEAGAARRAEEAQRLVAHGALLVERIERVVAERPAAPPLVAAFHPTPLEVDVMPLAVRLAAAGAQLMFPAAAEGRALHWITWDGNSAFLPSPGRGFGREPDGRRLGPEAPARADLVLAPAVAVDRSGTRIGHGGGYYDRALSMVPSSTAVVAVVHPSELLAAGALPRGALDVPVPAVLTADALVSLVTSARR
ncbi:5-formyltetrahydrofolate cyclo-ligase [Brachybacterium sp. YJGR34]|uniref:5-formyltetrahydrofolate cyclo-ligase n=1 Tax=Brachybacterium sp. YJGR34 TaxID=2059911 RepID=UPI000E0B74CB|nr:5-formyltetrahydrofolate cyclo-ligase [Brachybacterium sp. YJGR34]